MLMAQSVTTLPAIVTSSSGEITVTYHADGGNRGLMGLNSSAQVYAHTGVITSKSTSFSDWKYATTWGDNSPEYRLTYAGPDTWTLTIPSIASFYGITDPEETVRALMFVFRTADFSREGKTAAGADICVTVFPDNFPSSPTIASPAAKPQMGATANPDGSVTFCLGAPDKTNAVIVGSWDNFAISPAGVMSRTVSEGNDYFQVTVPGLADGKDYTYFYIVDGSTRCGDPYARLVLDPWNDKFISPTVFPDIPSYPTAAVNGVPVAVYNSSHDNYDWKIAGFKGVPQSDLIIYELLLRDFTGTEGNAYADGTVKGAIEKLDYLKDLGVNAIELLPIMEFNGNNSWGYNTNFYFAPDKAYGTPDDYRALIDGAHERGMAVILDIVFNQSDALHPWYDLYTQRNNPFYNGSAPHAYSVLNDWNQEFPMVQQQWHDALAYWLTAYNVDGFRFDLVKGLGANDSYGTTFDPSTATWSTPSDEGTNRYNATRVARMKELHAAVRSIKPDAYFINENLAYAIEENEMAEDGEANWANINYNACQYAMGWNDGSELNRFYAPSDERLWGSTVSYAESHDEERVAYKMKTYGATGVKGNLNRQMLRLGSLAAQMLLTPGAHMIWQFEELGNDQTTKNADGSNDTSPKRVNWNMLRSAPRLGLHDTYAALCAIRSDYAPMFREDVKTAVSLSSPSARYISLAKGSAELYVVVNPSVATSVTIPSPINPETGAVVNLSEPRFRLLASGYDTTPIASADGVTLEGSSFAVYGANLESGLSSPLATESDEVSAMTLYTLTGIRIATADHLEPGVYIVKEGGETRKVVIK
ncbi:MAG: hypothetical protein J1E29_02570 [Duncaniella sp.]|nr:hypothetical protein [Duncaniella sp.]